MYTTTKGKTLPLTPRLWRGIKRAAASRFGGSAGLFEACWREYRREIRLGTDDPECLSDVMGWIDRIASEKVNNSGSEFYIYG